jgi:hypothetical protein
MAVRCTAYYYSLRKLEQNVLCPFSWSTGYFLPQIAQIFSQINADFFCRRMQISYIHTYIRAGAGFKDGAAHRDLNPLPTDDADFRT